MLTFRRDGVAATADLTAGAQRARAGNASLLASTRARIARCRRRLNPAWGFSGASDDGLPTTRRRGLAVAPLTSAHPDRIVLGDVELFLSDGTTCPHQIGTRLEVFYVELADGRRFVEHITALPPAR